MNAKLIAKTLFVIVVLSLLVLMGMNNRQTVELAMPPLMKKQEAPAALMYFGFFAIGLLTGTILTAGGKRGGSGGKSGG
jgi:uncharacterized integral membrane protein